MNQINQKRLNPFLFFIDLFLNVIDGCGSRRKLETTKFNLSQNGSWCFRRPFWKREEKREEWLSQVQGVCVRQWWMTATPATPPTPATPATPKRPGQAFQPTRRNLRALYYFYQLASAVVIAFRTGKQIGSRPERGAIFWRPFLLHFFVRWKIGKISLSIKFPGKGFVGCKRVESVLCKSVVGSWQNRPLLSVPRSVRNSCRTSRFIPSNIQSNIWNFFGEKKEINHQFWLWKRVIMSIIWNNDKKKIRGKLPQCRSPVNWKSADRWHWDCRHFSTPRRAKASTESFHFSQQMAPAEAALSVPLILTIIGCSENTFGNGIRHDAQFLFSISIRYCNVHIWDWNTSPSWW